MGLISLPSRRPLLPLTTSPTRIFTQAPRLGSPPLSSGASSARRSTILPLLIRSLHHSQVAPSAGRYPENGISRRVTVRLYPLNSRAYCPATLISISILSHFHRAPSAVR